MREPGISSGRPPHETLARAVVEGTPNADDTVIVTRSRFVADGDMVPESIRATGLPRPACRCSPRPSNRVTTSTRLWWPAHIPPDIDDLHPLGAVAGILEVLHGLAPETACAIVRERCTGSDQLMCQRPWLRALRHQSR